MTPGVSPPPQIGLPASRLSLVRVIADGIDHPEAVIWDETRGLLFCGGEEGQLYAVELDGTVTQVAQTGGALLGLALDARGSVWACDAGAGAVVTIDPDDGAIELMSRGVARRALVEPNGIALDADGGAFVSCSGRWGANDGALFRIAPDGSTELWSQVAAQFPNGCVVQGDELLLIESYSARVVAISLTTRAAKLRCALGAVVPDQMALESGGGLMVGCYRPDLVLRVTPDGRVTEYLSDPAGMTLASPTGCTFAGPDRDMLVIANYGARQLLGFAAPEPGAQGTLGSSTR